jgi:hypothetical protein
MLHNLLTASGKIIAYLAASFLFDTGEARDRSVKVTEGISIGAVKKTEKEALIKSSNTAKSILLNLALVDLSAAHSALVVESLE